MSGSATVVSGVKGATAARIVGNKFTEGVNSTIEPTLGRVRHCIGPKADTIVIADLIQYWSSACRRWSSGAST
jgi:hypothetical protein